jgi:hypothetical protein
MKLLALLVNEEDLDETVNVQNEVKNVKTTQEYMI